MITRRELLRATALGMAGYSASGWLPALASAAAQDPDRRRHCILLWMNGGPSQIDTFDMKPGHANGGQFKEISTSVPGLRISEHLPGIAAMADQLAIVRSLQTKEGDHGRGSFLMRTGHSPGGGGVRYPSVGALLSKELQRADDDLPGYVSISPYRTFNRAAYEPGFLGPRYAPLTVGATDNYRPPGNIPEGSFAELTVDDLATEKREAFDARLELWRSLQKDFLETHKTAPSQAHDTVYRRAVRMMQSEASQAFDLSQETDTVRQAYGRGRFGQGCLMARRLVERGVPFVEVSLGNFGNGALGWDTHSKNFENVKRLSAELDAGWSTLMRELRERDLLERTTILWMGEFGRTPKINNNAGRDHFTSAWTCVLAGGGIRGGQAYGRTSPDGMKVDDSPVTAGDVLATLCRALGVNPHKQNTSDMNRPIRIAEGKAIKALLAG